MKLHCLLINFWRNLKMRGFLMNGKIKLKWLIKNILLKDITSTANQKNISKLPSNLKIL